MTRLERFIRLLEFYDDARSTISKRGDTVPSSRHDSNLLSIDAMWHEGSFDELERALAQLKQERPSQFWHLAERYLSCVSTIKVVEEKKRNRVTGEVTVTSKRRVVTKWNPAVRQEKVRRGLSFLSSRMPAKIRLPGRVRSRDELAA